MSKTITIAAKAPCQCRRFAAVNAEGRVIDHLVCARDTSNQFAQGHDARLKSFLIRHGVASHRILDRATGTIHNADSSLIGFGFRHMVVDGIQRRARKLAGKAGLVEAKVGRWVYEGKIRGGKFVYIDKSGNEKVTDKFVEVA